MTRAEALRRAWRMGWRHCKLGLPFGPACADHFSWLGDISLDEAHERYAAGWVECEAESVDSTAMQAAAFLRAGVAGEKVWS